MAGIARMAEIAHCHTPAEDGGGALHAIVHTEDAFAADLPSPPSCLIDVGVVSRVRGNPAARDGGNTVAKKTHQLSA